MCQLFSHIATLLKARRRVDELSACTNSGRYAYAIGYKSQNMLPEKDAQMNRLLS